MKVDLKDITIRAGKTFLQAFLASWALTGNQLSKTTLVAALAAGISAAWNYIIKTA